MRFGIHLGTVNPRFWVQVTEEADRLGYESVWVPEHLVVPYGSTGSPHAGAEHPPIPPDVPTFDALAVLAHFAGRTEQIRLGTHVYNIGLRHPFITARGATTVDVLSGGRMELGVGASWLREEWEAVGLDFDRRGPRVDEVIDVCCRLWRDDVVEHHGEFFDFDKLQFSPAPTEPVPIYIGGHTDVALRRAARVGDGWTSAMIKLADLVEIRGRLEQLLAERDRKLDGYEIQAVVIDRSGLDGYRQQRDAGVTDAIVVPWLFYGVGFDGPLQAKQDGIRRFADEVIGRMND